MYSIIRAMKYAWIAILLVPTLAAAQDPLSNSQEPGSLIVFPYFTTGTVTADTAVLPKTEIHIVNSTVEPTGIGEPGLPVVAASVCNAIYVLTQKRVRRLPIRPGDLA